MRLLKVKKFIKRNWYPIFYKWVYFPVLLSPLKPFVFESLGIWFPKINNMEAFYFISEELMQWITYFVIFFVYNSITFGIGKNAAVSDIEKYRKANSTFRSLTYSPKTFLFLIILGLLGYVLLYNLQGLLPRDPFILIVSAIMYGYAEYKYFKDKK